MQAIAHLFRPRALGAGAVLGLGFMPILLAVWVGFPEHRQWAGRGLGLAGRFYAALFLVMTGLSLAAGLLGEVLGWGLRLDASSF